MKKLKLLIADDHPCFRNGLIHAIRDKYPHADIKEVGHSEEAVKMIFEEEFDLLVSDVSMKGRSGIDLLKDVALNKPHLPVLILSFYGEEEYAVRAFKAGAKGFINKQCSISELIYAIETILSGKKYISAKVAEVFSDNLFSQKTQLPHELLSDRELEVFKLIANGNNNKKISAQLSLSQTTVSTYRWRILNKMKISGDVLLAKYALEHGLL